MHTVSHKVRVVYLSLSVAILIAAGSPAVFAAMMSNKLVSVPNTGQSSRPDNNAHILATPFIDTPAHTNTASDAAALKFIEATGIYKNLSLLLLNEVKTSTPVQAAIRQHGFETVKTAVVQAIRVAQTTYAGEWNTMMAGIYNQHFNKDELRSILMEKEQSPHFEKMITLQPVIAAAVAVQGKAIFEEAQKTVLQQISTDFAV
ncbi:DUF2059 domain-containing protein [Kordiimonas pumila]|uniref:DUF2059 domain-containing protein n=1 Tax=Kordiimonas pumila TaxID=2161677 RepID=A0ABV7D7D9_9PROT|nr:hypothetical protein [Kordiimonas pumila]